MNYQETLDFMYSQLPMYQRIGKAAYRKDLDNTLALCDAVGNPQFQFKSIHVAGTNGKGSTSHCIAAILQQAGLKVGLFTSPHLQSYTERIKINGEEINPSFVVDFVQKIKEPIELIKPSFFEMTTVMAFAYFAAQKVDIAVIEVGLGGRLDSTNIIMPELCVITSISFDHKEFLGDTLPQIASEKAGIIKPQIPVVISKRQPETDAVFEQNATEKNAPIYFADDDYEVLFNEKTLFFDIYKKGEAYWLDADIQLKGNYQRFNIGGVLKACDLIAPRLNLLIPKTTYQMALSKVCDLTHFKGRWQVLARNPLTIADVAHNEDGIGLVMKQLQSYATENLHIVYGTVKDKDVDSILAYLPKKAIYYFCKPDVPRGLEADILQEKALPFGLKGNCYSSVMEAYRAAQQQAEQQDMIFVGGSCFVVAEVL